MVDRRGQILGGMSFCNELPVERYYREARVDHFFDGTSEIHRSVIARSVLKRGAMLFDVHGWGLVARVATRRYVVRTLGKLARRFTLAR